MVNIKVNISNLNAFGAALKQSPSMTIPNLNVAIKKTIFFIQAESQKEAPVRTGNLRASARTNFAPLKGEIEYRAKYAMWVHEGTSPYIINAKAGSGLYWKGAAHPMKRVNHPGISANPFLKRAIENNQGQIDEFFEKALQDTLDSIAKASK